MRLRMAPTWCAVGNNLTAWVTAGFMSPRSWPAQTKIFKSYATSFLVRWSAHFAFVTNQKLFVWQTTPALDWRPGFFLKTLARALRVTKAIRSGIIWVNTYRVVSPLAPFGGYKNSGYGRESGLQAIYDYTRPKTVWLNTSAEPIADPFVMQ